MSSRREFLQQSAATSMALSLSAPVAWVTADAAESPVPGFVDLRQDPDGVSLQTESGLLPLTRHGPGRFSDANSEVQLLEEGVVRSVRLTTSLPAVLRLRLRWRATIAESVRVCGDAWERGYGDLEWRGLVPDRLLPWYCAVSDGVRTHGYGVRTGARAMCAWQVDAHGITLWADLRSGGVGLRLGGRVLDVCTVVARAGVAGESAFRALGAFCRMLCPAPRLPAAPVYGHNDWYWAYGKNSAESVRVDARRIVELSPTGANRPFVVIDDGWQPGRVTSDDGSGYWDRGNEKFPDMAALTSDVRAAGARAGIWCRPLLAPGDAPDNQRLSRDRSVLDPTVPAVRQKVHDDIARMAGWGYELIKHDYSTWDIFGRWGFQMGGSLTRPGWSFAEGSGRTTAEIIDELYRTIREAAGDRLVIGCNTVSHLSAGRFELCRIGDDSSGSDWGRTRKMGINSLAFRAVQHGAFYAADPDCVGVLTRQSWPLIRQWLDLLARSGTVLMTSIEPGALGAEQRREITAALALAAEPRPVAEPLDWQRLVYPSNWRLMGAHHSFDWAQAEGEDEV
jgi:alpha-galactosidase